MQFELSPSALYFGLEAEVESPKDAKDDRTWSPRGVEDDYVPDVAFSAPSRTPYYRPDLEPDFHDSFLHDPFLVSPDEAMRHSATWPFSLQVLDVKTAQPAPCDHKHGTLAAVLSIVLPSCCKVGHATGERSL